MHLLFLDFDGVLKHKLHGANLPREDCYGRIFSPQIMDNLYRIVGFTGAYIVMRALNYRIECILLNA